MAPFISGVLMAAMSVGLAPRLRAQELIAPPMATVAEPSAPVRLPPIDAGDGNMFEEDLPLESLTEADVVETEKQEIVRDPSRSASRGGPPGMFGSESRSPIGVRAFWEPSQGVAGQPTDFEMAGQEARAAFPIWASEPHLTLFSLGIGADLFDTAATFPTSGTEFPETLWNIKLGLNYIRKLENGWTAGGMVSVGSAADRPFDQLRDVNAGVVAFLNIPREGDNAWNFLLFYSPLSEIPFPIPGVSYHWHVSDEFEMNIGVPAQITYRPTEQLTLEASYMLLRTIHTQVTWTINDDWCAYAAFDWENRSWFLHDRTQDNERLFRYDQSLRIGVQRKLFDKFQFDVAAGYLFNRFYFLGEDYAD